MESEAAKQAADAKLESALATVAELQQYLVESLDCYAARVKELEDDKESTHSQHATVAEMDSALAATKVESEVELASLREELLCAQDELMGWVDGAESALEQSLAKLQAQKQAADAKLESALVTVAELESELAATKVESEAAKLRLKLDVTSIDQLQQENFESEAALESSAAFEERLAETKAASEEVHALLKPEEQGWMSVAAWTQEKHELEQQHDKALRTLSKTCFDAAIDKAAKAGERAQQKAKATWAEEK